MGTPKFTVEWESRWQEFWTSVPVVLRRVSPATAPNHVRTGARVPGPAAAIALEFALASLALSAAPAVLGRPQQRVQLKSGFENYTVYYVRDDLPNVSDLEGAEEGRTGKLGGSHSYHPRQVIRIAHGHAPVAAVADAPSLRLPVTQQAVANLLAFAGAAAARVLPATPDVSSLRNRVERAPQAEAVPAAPALAEVRSRSLEAPAQVTVVQPAPEVTALPQRYEAPPSAVVLPPPPMVTSLAHKRGAVLMAEAVPPAPGIANLGHTRTAAFPAATVVPPPPAVAGTRGKGPASIAAIEVAAPPARAAGGPGGRGLAGDATEPGGNGTGQANAVVLSANAGSAVGVPAGAQPGVAVLSPSGGGAAGAGGHGGSAGAGTGSGSGRGSTGTGTGGGNHGQGYGTDPLAHGGISASAGPGGAGGGNSSHSASGIFISGGVVTIPGFGSSAEPPSQGHPPREKNNPPAVVIIATSRSGGGLAEYGVLRGSRVYTTYLSTSQGNVVLQYADPAAGGTDLDLTPPQLLNSNLPDGSTLLRTVISCILEPTGTLKNIHVLDSATPGGAAALIRYLDNWRFRPALRGDKAVAAQAILAFGITTQ